MSFSGKIERETLQLTHIALVLQPNPHRFERVRDDGAFRRLGDIGVLAANQDRNTDGKHGETEKKGSPEAKTLFHLRSRNR